MVFYLPYYVTPTEIFPVLATTTKLPFVREQETVPLLATTPNVVATVPPANFAAVLTDQRRFFRRETGMAAKANAAASGSAASSVAHCRTACLVVAARAPTFAAEKTQSLRPLLRDVDKLIVKVVASRVEPAIPAPQIGAGPGWPRPGATHLHTRRHPRWRLSA